MKFNLRKSLGLALVASMVVGAMPTAAFAADDEDNYEYYSTTNPYYGAPKKEEPAKPEVVEPAKAAIVLKLDSKTAMVGDKEVALDAAAALVNGRTMVPLRFVAETFGATVTYDKDTKGITVKLGEKEVKMTVGVEIEGYGVAPTMSGDVTLVPVRFVTEQLGAVVAWDETAKTITIAQATTPAVPTTPATPVVPTTPAVPATPLTPATPVAPTTPATPVTPGK